MSAAVEDPIEQGKCFTMATLFFSKPTLYFLNSPKKQAFVISYVLVSFGSMWFVNNGGWCQ